MLLESRRGEYALAVLPEADPNVIAFFSQPPEIFLKPKDEQGKALTTSRYTPNFLVVRRDGLTIKETRDGSRLLDRAAKSPYQFYREIDGAWNYRAASEHFTGLGFKYELIANSSLPGRLVENIGFLEDFTREDCPPLDSLHAESIKHLLARQRYVSLKQAFDEGVPANSIYKAIVDQLVYVDLLHCRLADTGGLMLFADKKIHDAYQLTKSAEQDETVLPIPGTISLVSGSRLVVSGVPYTVLLPGERDVMVKDSSGNQRTFSRDELMKGQKFGSVEADGLRSEVKDLRLADCSDEELARAAERFEAIQPGATSKFSARSIARFRSAVAALPYRVEKLLALVDKRKQQGNSQSRFSDANRSLMDQAISDNYNTADQPTIKGAYLKYVGRCEAGGVEDIGVPLEPVSYSTFCKYAKQRTCIKAREGRRSAYQKQDIYQSLESVFAVNGSRPHEICHIDHTIANLATVSHIGTPLGKPTLSVAVDAHTTQPRACILSYDPPSTRTVMMVLRDYVRRHHRLPDILVLDNGPEFRAHELQQFCSLYGVEIRYRSPGMPRGGAMMERLLGATEDEVLSEMQGNTRAMKTGTRLTTMSTDPYRRAVWTLEAAYRAMEEYLFETRPNRTHPALGVSPAEFEMKRLEETGRREFRGVRLDENFMLMTSPHAKKPFHCVDPQRGVWVDGLWYRHPDIKNVPKGQKVEVRIEPWNASVVYLRICGKWVAAVGSDRRWLVDRSVREMEIALREHSRRSKVAANQDTRSLRANKAKSRVFVATDFDAVLAEKQRAMRGIYAPLGMCEAIQKGEASPLQIAAPEGSRDEVTTEIDQANFHEVSTDMSADTGAPNKRPLVARTSLSTATAASTTGASPDRNCTSELDTTTGRASKLIQGPKSKIADQLQRVGGYL